MAGVRHNKGTWIVVGILLVGIGGYYAISNLARQSRSPVVEQNISHTESKHHLGAHAKALFKLQDIDRDGMPETVAYTPLFPDSLPPGADHKGIYVQKLSVLRHTKRKTFEVLRLDSQGIFNERNEALLPVAGVVYGYSVDTDSTDNGILFLFTQVDATGKAVSQPLPVQFNSASMFYEAIRTP
ncbi:MAG: hypothetical protein KF690_05145 [Bacteroidetes bacterium]|nr:hypothetical protein [Bacteroidota bacterium]